MACCVMLLSHHIIHIHSSLSQLLSAKSSLWYGGQTRCVFVILYVLLFVYVYSANMHVHATPVHMEVSLSN